MRPSGKAISIHSYRLHHRSRRGRCNRITVSVEKLANIAELSAISAKNLPFGILTILRQSEFRYTQWDEINFGAKTLPVPLKRRKDKHTEPVVVPLGKSSTY